MQFCLFSWSWQKTYWDYNIKRADDMYQTNDRIHDQLRVIYVYVYSLRTPLSHTRLLVSYDLRSLIACHVSGRSSMSKLCREQF